MNIKLQALFIVALFSSWTSAETVSDLSTSHWFLTANLGPAWTTSGETQILFVQPSIKKAYIADKNTRTLIDGEFFLGYQSGIAADYFGQLGIAYGFTNQVKFTGNIWEDADPDFNNYYYQYDAMYSHITVKAKLFKQWTPTLAPYLGASVGVGFNRATRFHITPIIPEEVPAPPFTGRTIYDAFAYTFEAGIQRTIDAHWLGGVNYHFADWGKTALGPGLGYVTSQGIQNKNFYTNGLQFNLTYVA